MSRSETLKSVRSLHQKKRREEQRLFLVQGLKMVAELLASPLEVVAIHATVGAARAIGDPRVQVWAEHEMDRMGTFDSGNDAVAVVRMPPAVAFAPLRAGELVLALDGVSDPGNLGTILRIADRFGVRGVLLGSGSVEVYNPKCVQASMGSVLRITTYEVDLPSTIGAAKVKGAAIYRAEMDGADVFNTTLTRPAVLVLGSKSHGISDDVRAVGGVPITIPQFGGAESLNVAMAAAALCMEFARRIR